MNEVTPSIIQRVLVLSADDLTRAGLAALVSEFPGFSVAGQTADVNKLADDIDVFAPDLVVWDVFESFERLSVLLDIDIPVVVVVPNEEAAGLALANGARGVVPRNVGREALSAALTAASKGLTVVDNRFVEAIARPAPMVHTLAESLTPRELQVLQLVAEGLPNKSIASELAISEHTVKFHINSVLGKLGATSRTQAVTAATRLGLIKL
jgi:DNA-binding NarL/FixJ family response regulator